MLKTWSLVVALHFSLGSGAVATAAARPESMDQSPVPISGTVVDESAGAIEGATVIVLTRDGSRRGSALSNETGNFTLAGVPHGSYIVEVQKPLFETARVDLDLTQGVVDPLRVVLRVAGFRESVTVAVPKVDDRPAGQTVTIDRDQFKDTRGFSVGDIVVFSPGVTVVQANGPRDVSVSIRGSNARTAFGIRNIQVFEDGFPVTQPDGTARTDALDPQVYGAIDVVRGPSSALYGNYATGGAINFRTRPGGEVNGFEVGADGGSFGYLNNYVAFGHKGNAFEILAFGSRASGDGFTEHTAYKTTTENVLATYTPSPSDTFTFKLLNNDLDSRLSIRLSLNQFAVNPFQENCAALEANACASVSLFANGFNGARVNLSAEQAGLGRRKVRRTVIGGRWEHLFRRDTTWRTQFVFDNRDIREPTGATAILATFPSFNVMSDVTRQSTLFDREATHFAGAFVNYQNINSYTYNVAPGGNGTLGALSSLVLGHHANFGARAREEIRFTPRWTAIGGIGVEHTSLRATNTVYGYPVGGTPTTTIIPVDRGFLNAAPDAAVFFRADRTWEFHGRVAAAYGTPQVGNLFVTPAGVSGNNTELDSQSNIGFDFGVDVRAGSALRASVTWFYELFYDELVTQSPGVNLQNFTFNAPASRHHGVEVTADWYPAAARIAGAHVMLAYTYDDQRYTEYVERLSAGTFSVAFDRAGNRIPGVPPHYLNLRAAYDQPSGVLEGLGGFIELNGRDGAFMDNANLIKVPSYRLVNLNLHYDSPRGRRPGVQVMFEIRNIADRIYAASAANVSNSISATTGVQNPASVLMNSGSIWAGAPRSVFSGVRVRF